LADQTNREALQNGQQRPAHWGLVAVALEVQWSPFVTSLLTNGPFAYGKTLPGCESWPLKTKR